MPFVRKSPRLLQQSADIQKDFIGRTNELLYFTHNILEAEEPEQNIISISGQGGIGKSTLINRFIDEAHGQNFIDYCITARVDERWTSPVQIMDHFAEQLRSAKQPLKNFEEVLSRYKESLRRMRADNEEHDLVLHETIDAAGSIVEDIPFAGGIIHKGASSLTEIFIDKAHERQLLKDMAQLEDPIKNLTKAFTESLNQITNTQINVGPHSIKRQRRVILFFDTYERLAHLVAPWLLDYFLDNYISSNVVLVIAGRNPIQFSTPDGPKRWLPYFENDDVYDISLDSFTEEETRLFLEQRGIIEPAKISQIWSASRGFPLYLGILAYNPHEIVDPTIGVVENFLKWIPTNEVLKRRLAREASLFSRSFNQDDLAAFTYLKEERLELYQWLINQSFILSNSRDGRHIYHEVAQEMFSQNLYRHSSKEYYSTRQALASYYQQRAEIIQAESGQEVYKSAEWLAFMLASSQQLFLLSGESNLKQAIEQVLKVYEFADEEDKIISTLRVLSQEKLTNHIGIKSLYFVDQLLKFLEASSTDLHQELVAITSSLIKQTSQIPSFSPRALAYLYRWRGRAYRLLKNYKEAIADYDQAIAFINDYSNAYVGRGDTYRLLGDYQQALISINRAIELNPSDPDDYALRGETYNFLNNHQQALANFDHAIELDPSYTWAYIQRGRTHRLLKNYQQALTDFNRALESDSSSAYYIYAQRGGTHRLLKNYQQALADCDHAIELNPSYIWAYVQRGFTYSSLKDYQQALANFDHAIELDPSYTWAYIQRGRTHRLLKNYQQALTDFNHVIESDSSSAHIYAQRGETHRLLKNYQQALADCDHAIELDPSYTWAYVQRGSTYGSLKDYQQALADFDHAIELNPNNADSYARRGETYRLLKNYQQALADLNHAIELDPSYTWAYVQRGFTYGSLENYQQALADFNRAIELDPNNVDSYARRGETYRLLKDYQQALADSNHAIELNPSYWWAFICRGEIYTFTGHYGEALSDFNRAIEIDEKSDWCRFGRARLYFLTGQVSSYTNEMNTAVIIAQDNLNSSNSLLDRWTIAFNLALYHLFDSKLVEAQSQYKELLATCTALPYLWDALTDLEELLKVQPQNEIARQLIDQLQEHIVRIEQQPAS